MTVGITRFMVLLTFSIVVITQISLVHSSGTSSIISLVVGANIALAAGYCQACFLKSTPRCPKAARRLMTSSLLTDTRAIYNFFVNISQDCSSSLLLFAISWMHLMFKLGLLCILYKVALINIRVLDPFDLPEFLKKDLGNVWWHDGGYDVTTCVLTTIWCLLGLVFMRLTHGCMVRMACCNFLTYFFYAMISCIVLGKFLAFVILVSPYFNLERVQTWLKWDTTHPKGIHGLMRSTAACAIASTSWTLNTDQDHRRVTFVVPFMLSFVLNTSLLVVFAFLVDFSNLSHQASDTPIPLYIFQQHDSLWIIRLLGSLDIIVLLLFSLTLLSPIVASIDVITSKLGNPIRVDLTTVVIKPTIIRKIVWFLAIFTVLALELLCSLDQLIAISESFGLLLISFTFLITIIRSYKTTSMPQYAPLSQREPSSEETSSQRTQLVIDDHPKPPNESSEDSDTDIDSIVEEYKIRRRLEDGLSTRRRRSVVRNDNEAFEANMSSFLKIKVIVNLSIGLTGILSILMVHVKNNTVLMGSAIAYVIVSFFLYAFAIKQPKNSGFEPKLPLMPLVPLLCLNVCVFLQPFCLQEVWPPVMIMTFLGLLFHTVTRCIRRDDHESQYDDSYTNNGFETGEHSICLQPLPNHGDQLKTTVLPAHSQRRSKSQNKKTLMNARFSKGGKDFNVINQHDPSVT